MRLSVLVCAAVALVTTAVVALPALAQNPEVTATPAATGTSPPAKPHNLQATASHDQVTLTWTASVDPTVTHYAILRRDRNADAIGVFHVIEPNTGADTSYTDNSVSASGSYVYRTKSVSPTGVSKWSGYRRADTPPAPPPPEPAPPPEPPTTTTQPPEPEPPPTATTQPPTIGTGTIERSAPKPPPPPDPDPYSVLGDDTQGEPPLVPRSQVVIRTDQDSVIPGHWALKPSGLSRGDQFRLLFITFAGHAPTSTDIDDYNTYVQSQANAGNAHSAIKPYSSGFRVVGSTRDDDARDNTSTEYTSSDKGVPIYWLNGNKVADDYEDFYDGGWDDEANPRGRNGTRVGSDNAWIFTGSKRTGVEEIVNGISYALGQSNVAIGWLTAAGGPVGANLGGTVTSFSNTTSTLRYYALSEVFTVGGSTPVFSDSDPAARSVPENSGSGTSVGARVAATDADSGDTLTYSLGGTDAASFTIVSSSGQIRTKSGVSYDHETRSRYSVVVTVTDSTFSASITVTITVTDVDEPPSAAPGAPTVSAVTSPDRLYVTWTAPANTSHPINDYDVRYRTDGTGNWSNWPHTGTRLAATIIGLTSNTAYEVQVRAGNVEGHTDWSPSGTGTTGTMTTVPGNWELKPSGLVAGNEFRLLFLTHRTVDPTSSDIDDYNDYAQSQANLSGFTHRAIRPYHAGFRVVASTSAVAARDNSGTSYTNDDTGLPIYWLNGSKVADDYADFYDGDWDDEANPRFRDGNVDFQNNGEVWTGSTSTGTAKSSALGASSVTIGRLNGTGGPLDAGVTYTGLSLTTRNLAYYALSEVFAVGTADNSAPVFSDTAPASRSIAENTGAGTNVGAPVAASDADTATTGELLTYSLGGSDASSFAIDATSGQIRTRSGVSYNFEAKSGYSVTVTVTDGTHTDNNTATIAVTITLTDVTEPPGTPGAPTVRQVGAMTDRLGVTWEAPANTGPAITDYDVQYRIGDSGTWTDLSHTGTGRTLTILALTAATLFDVQVQVQAKNAEGTGAWSPAGRAPNDICGRTAAIVEAILAATPAADTCSTVLGADMANIAELAPSDWRGYHLQSDDFAGLTTLTRLDLTGMNVTGLPADGFDGIEDLLELDLSGSGLRQLAAGNFDGLPTLSVLDLSDNLISDLPTRVFDGLTNLIELDLSDTALISGLSRDTFTGLGNLQTLRIANTSQEHRTGETGFSGVIIHSEGSIDGYRPILPGDFFEHLRNLRELDMRPHSPLLAAPLSLLPLTDLVTYNGAPYTRPAAPPRNLTATMSDIDRSWMVRGTSFCKSVRLTWAAPTGVSGITGYKIRRTHYGHPVRETGRGNLQGGHTFVRHTEDFGRYGYDIATVGANTTSYTHKPLRPGAAGHKFTYYVAAVTNNGDGFPAKVKAQADVLLKWSSIGSATTGPDVLDCPMRW